MSDLIRAELLKLRTVRTLLWIGLGMLVLVALPVISVAVSSGELGSPGDDRSVARIAAISVVFALMLGIVVIGGEGTHGTITQTFLVAPVRERVLAAKAIVAASVGLALGIVAEAVTLVVAVPGASLNVHNSRLVLAGTLIACATAAATGVGIGALFHRQGPAIVVVLLWLLIAEHIFVFALHGNIRYMPGHVFAAAVSGNRHASSESDIVGAWAGVVGTAIYAAAFLVAGAATLSRRDV